MALILLLDQRNLPFDEVIHYSSGKRGNQGMSCQSMRGSRINLPPTWMYDLHNLRDERLVDKRTTYTSGQIKEVMSKRKWMLDSIDGSIGIWRDIAVGRGR